MSKSRMRWNFRIGPLQFSSPTSLFGVTVVALLVVLCCCGSTLYGAYINSR